MYCMAAITQARVRKPAHRENQPRAGALGQDADACGSAQAEDQLSFCADLQQARP